MPKVKVEAQSKHAPIETFRMVKDLLENDRDLKKLDSAYKCQFDSKALSGIAKGNKFTAEMQIVSQADAALVKIEIEIPLLLSPFKGTIQSTLQKKLDSILA
jgi:hypothetical protein